MAIFDHFSELRYLDELCNLTYLIVFRDPKCGGTLPLRFLIRAFIVELWAHLGFDPPGWNLKITEFSGLWYVPVV